MGLLSHQTHQEQPSSAAVYVRHRPETTLLYQIVQEYWPEFLNGVYIGGSSGHPLRFRWVKAPTRNELTQLTHTIAQRIGRYLERQGLLEPDNPFSGSVGEAAEFPLHAGLATKANEHSKLERLCRYITRPAISTKRLSLTHNGQVRYELKTSWHNGTTHIIFEPLDFMFRTNGMSRAHGCAGATISRLVALVPKPRVNLTRFLGVFA